MSIAWARAARPIVAELDAVAAASPSRELVELLQRAVAHVVKVMMRADDSSGLIGDLARHLLDIHAAACDTAVADPGKLAAWTIQFRFGDQDFFEVDPVRYGDALGDRGPRLIARLSLTSSAMTPSPCDMPASDSRFSTATWTRS